MIMRYFTAVNRGILRFFTVLSGRMELKNMAKKANMPQNTGRLYINVENFLQAKRQLKEMKKDCTDRKLSELLDCDIRTIQKYRSEKHQFPIPRLRLEKLAQYMDVSPEWLCGLDNSALGGVGWSEIVALQNGINKHDQRQLLAEYLQAEGIKGRENNWPAINEHCDASPDLFTTISGTPVTLEQFHDYLEELEAAIEYITDRFILRLKK